MDGPRDSHTKQNKSERQRQKPYDLTYMWNLKYYQNEHIYEIKKRLTDLENRLVVAKGRWWKDREFGISRCRLLRIGWTSSKVLLCSTGSYTQYSVTNHRIYLCDPIHYSPPDSSLHGIFQARILEWVAISFSMGFSWPRDQTWVSCIADGFFANWATRKPHNKS